MAGPIEDDGGNFRRFGFGRDQLADRRRPLRFRAGGLGFRLSRRDQGFAGPIVDQLGRNMFNAAEDRQARTSGRPADDRPDPAVPAKPG